MMTSPTFGQVTMAETAEGILDWLNNHKGENNHIVIGTDSQNHSKTKVVVAIAIYTDGRGGRFYYNVTSIPKISNVRQKIHMETATSLEYMDSLLSELDKIDTDGDYLNNASIGIHVDASYGGVSGQVIPEVIGWIKSVGYEVEVKPKSFVASTIADRISK